MNAELTLPIFPRTLPRKDDNDADVEVVVKWKGGKELNEKGLVRAPLQP